MNLFPTRSDRKALRCGLAATCGMMAVVTATVARADFTENFDGVTSPALPAGWTATNASGPAPLWVTTTTDSDSAPNNAFIDSPDATVTDKRLDTPPIPIASNTAVLTFRNKYSLNPGETSTEGAHCGVLEISIDGGAFQDILTAGGSFVGAGYTHTVSSNFMNPIGGRMAWSGNSAGYITTTVNLPAAAGKNIVLRFRMGSDNASGPFPGWHIDSIEVREDKDGDGVADFVDVCPDTANPGQENADGDGLGNACDNCPDAANDDQADGDGDGKGDACDNCPSVFNADQADADNDGVGDVCDAAPPPDAACGTCAQGVLPGTLLSLSLMMWGRRRRWRRNSSPRT